MVINGKEYVASDIMRPAVTVTQEATLEEVITRMVSEKRNSLVVVDGDGVLIGAVNAIDVIKAVLPDYLEESQVAARFGDFDLLKEDARRVSGMQVREFMSKDVPTIAKSGNLLEAAVMASTQGRGRITVVDEAHRPVGVLTRTEIKQIIGQALGVSGDLFS